MIKFLDFFKKRFFGLVHYRLLIGRNPLVVEGPAIIFAPIVCGRLNCGFAGLMTVKFPDKTFLSGDDPNIDSAFEKIREADLKKVVSGKLAVQDYLHGWVNLTDLEKTVQSLKQEAAQELFFFQQAKTEKLLMMSNQVKNFLAAEEENIEKDADKLNSQDLEVINSRLILLKDIQWMLEKDILANFDKIISLSGAQEKDDLNPASFKKYRKINLLLNALDRLEVRGRDSAGIQIIFALEKNEDIEGILSGLQNKGLLDDFQNRSRYGDLLNGSIRVHSCPVAAVEKKTKITFTYKTFSVVGELGRNVRELRKIISNDRILRDFAQVTTDCETAITHTRWASVGSITEENCHPVNNYKYSLPGNKPFVSEAAINVVLNGDIDNYPALCAALDANQNLIAPEVTTDTKIIPLQIEKYLIAGNHLAESFRQAVNSFAGSHAIVMTSELEPGKIFLALKGSGQSIYVGISEDQYMLSSELYGLIEAMPGFIKMNGEADLAAENAAAGQIFILDQNSQGGLTGIKACSYDGRAIHLTTDNIQRAQITTRDIDRGSYPHFFLKEISESTLSVRKTLRGKYRIETRAGSASRVTFNLGSDIIPVEIRKRFRDKEIKNVMIIGHGTAAVAGMAIAEAFERHFKKENIHVTARVASELSGFLLKDDLSDTLIIPISQSGTTTDTNRAIAMARERGAWIIAIVNRRQSDITTKSHGVFYTSDGRDIEMSVASTKAFYSQIVAGQILALYFAQLASACTDDYIVAELRNLEEAPELMANVFAMKEQIAESVKKTFDKKFWAVVGSGPNKTAADEIRIKLSELCYKTISSDIIENKKHIDLSAEPLILVCAAGNPESVMEDVAKDVAIFKAHKAAVVVFAEEGDARFNQTADSVISIPRATGPLPVILNTMAGHLWGYYAARRFDDEAQIFRKFRGHLSAELSKRAKQKLSIFEILDTIADASFCRIVNDFYSEFKARSQGGAFDALGGKTITDLTLLLKYAAGKLPLQDMRQEFRDDEELINPFDLLDAALGSAIDELTRPIDAIRHQAKTVTVGTSRKEKELKGVIFDLLESLKFSAKNLSFRNILTIHRLQPAVSLVRGYSVYDIGSSPEHGHPATIAIAEKGGIAANMLSRADHGTPLMGVKKTIVSTGNVYLGRGKMDGANIMIVPLQDAHSRISNLLLVHIAFSEILSLREKINVLGERYDDIRNLVNEFNLTWNDRYLEKWSLESLFSEPIDAIAGKIKSQFGPS